MRFEREKLEQRLKYKKQIEGSRKDQTRKDKSINQRQATETRNNKVQGHSYRLASGLEPIQSGNRLG